MKRHIWGIAGLLYILLMLLALAADASEPWVPTDSPAWTAYLADKERLARGERVLVPPHPSERVR